MNPQRKKIFYEIRTVIKLKTTKYIKLYTRRRSIEIYYGKLTYIGEILLYKKRTTPREWFDFAHHERIEFSP